LKSLKQKVIKCEFITHVQMLSVLSLLVVVVVTYASNVPHDCSRMYKITNITLQTTFKTTTRSRYIIVLVCACVRCFISKRRYHTHVCVKATYKKEETHV